MDDLEKWNRILTGVGPAGPDWIDPATRLHCDLTSLTSAIRAELAQATRKVNGTLDMIDRHPWNA